MTTVLGTQFLTAHDVAAFLQIAPVTVYRLVDRGLLAAYRVARRLRFTDRDVQAYLEHQKQDAYGGPQN